MHGFKTFILRGNVVDLAVGVVVGGAFGVLVGALVRDFLTPLIAAIGGGGSFEKKQFVLNGSPILYGDFLNAVIAFLLVAAAVYFFVVLPVNALMERSKTEPDVTSTTKQCPECLSAIPDAARRCAFCTVEQPVGLR